MTVIGACGPAGLELYLSAAKTPAPASAAAASEIAIHFPAADLSIIAIFGVTMSRPSGSRLVPVQRQPKRTCRLVRRVNASRPACISGRLGK